ncbi:MAG: PIN domain-containing protein, partial [Actinomycetota bacterium]|nr:PIN domain-containing protein [Actinomycetota bacterium]
SPPAGFGRDSCGVGIAGWSGVSGRDRVFVDANELFPFSVMDLVLSLAEDLLIDFVWTDELLDEWERVIVREGKRTPETARSVSAAIRRFFVTTQIDPTTYRDRVQDVPGRDPDDRVHAAACAFGGATVLLTRNRRDFPGDFLTEHGVTVSSADDYLTGLLRRRPMAFLDVVGRLASEKQRPPVAPCDLAAGLGRGGAPRLSASLRRRLGCL